MFLRDKDPSELTAKVAHGMQVSHFAAMIAGASLLNLCVIAHLVIQGASPAWLWLQAVGIVLLAVTVTGLIMVVKKVGPWRVR